MAENISEEVNGALNLDAIVPSQSVAGATQAPSGLFLGKLFSVLVLISLPVMYLAVFCLCLWLAGDYLVAHFAVIGQSMGWLYVLLGLVTIALLFLLIKPVFWLRDKQEDAIELKESEQKTLFEFTRRLAKLINAPAPDRIRLDSRLNAGALRNASNQGRGNELLLGLPLIAGSSIQGLAGIITHELRHFAQQRLDKLETLIRRINYWFEMAVYGRDRFDLWIHEHKASENAFRQLFGWILFVPTCLGRAKLWVFMRLAQIGSCYLARQSEFDADESAAAVIGGRAMARTLTDISLLAVAEHVTHSALQESWDKRRMPDNIPRMAAEQARMLSPNQKAAVQALINYQRTGMLDTHPSDAQRIAGLKRVRAEGVVTDKRSATILINDFDAFCELQTVGLYKEVLGEEFKDCKMVPTGHILSEMADREVAYGSALRFYQGVPSRLRVLLPQDDGKLPGGFENLDQALQKLIDVRREMVDQSKFLHDDLNMLAETEKEQGYIEQLRLFKILGMPIPLDADYVCTELARSRVSDKLKRIHERSKRRFYIASMRLTISMQLIDSPLASQIFGRETAGIQATTRKIKRLLPLIRHATPLVREIANRQAVIGSVVSHKQASESVDKRLDRSNEVLDENLQKLKALTEPFTYPFSHGEGEVSIAQYLMPELDDIDDWLARLLYINGILDRFDTLVSDTVAHACHLAEQVEDAMCLERIEYDAETTLSSDELMRDVSRRKYKPQSSLSTQLLMTAMTFLLGIGATWLMSVGATVSAVAVLPKHKSYKPVSVPTSWGTTKGPGWARVGGMDPMGIRNHVPWGTGQVRKPPSPFRPHNPNVPNAGNRQFGPPDPNDRVQQQLDKYGPKVPNPNPNYRNQPGRYPGQPGYRHGNPQQSKPGTRPSSRPGYRPSRPTPSRPSPSRSSGRSSRPSRPSPGGSGGFGFGR